MPCRGRRELGADVADPSAPGAASQDGQRQRGMADHPSPATLRPARRRPGTLGARINANARPRSPRSRARPDEPHDAPVGDLAGLDQAPAVHDMVAPVRARPATAARATPALEGERDVGVRGEEGEVGCRAAGPPRRTGSARGSPVASAGEGQQDQGDTDDDQREPGRATRWSGRRPRARPGDDHERQPVGATGRRRRGRSPVGRRTCRR